jgi:flagellin
LKGTNGASAGYLTYNTANTNLTSDIGAVNTTTGTVSITLEPKDKDGVIANNSDTVFTGKEVKLGNTTYVYVASTSLDANATGTTKLSVSEAVDELSKETNKKAFSSMDSMMAAIKAQYGEDIKAINSYINDDGDVALKVETFADLNDAVDVSLHVGADSSSDNKITMNIAQMSARGLGVNGLNVSGDTADNATKSIDTIADALSKVSAQRSTLGAIQNRLEHTINNLDNVVENTTSAESAIRDTDMATEMVTYSNNNILAQAGQAMLAQANQSNQGVLSLLG